MAGFSLEGKRVWVAGHRGMVGKALVRRLAQEGCEIVAADRSELDLRNQAQVFAWVEKMKPQAVFLAAAKVGGIYANATYPADFLYDNVMIEANVMEASFRNGVEKLMFLASSAIYPKLAETPIVEEALFTGPFEPSHEAYAIAKVAGIKLAAGYRKQHGCDFISGVPTNLYGPGDNYNPLGSHVMPALIRKAHEGKLRGDQEMVIWGTGTPRREFLHADDCADACVHLMKHYSDLGHINVGSGEDTTILDLTRLVCSVVGFEGEFVYDTSKPDGPMRKLMSADKIRALGWAPKVTLAEGVKTTYADFLAENLERA
ncbi:GDP-L-fucose synthase family protein [Xanthobacter wiegelii]|uniref:GDP-L-fucose synthase family protein n=1 Tax=Xanthobacter wiegelii TaxID=3119913 RepID=UPI003726BBB9